MGYSERWDQELGTYAVGREPRCWKCKKKVAKSVARPWEIKCQCCKSTNAQPA